MLEIVSIPTLDGAIFTGREDEVSTLEEPDTGDAVFMTENRLVAVTKVQPPDSQVLVGRAANQESSILQRIHHMIRQKFTYA